MTVGRVSEQRKGTYVLFLHFDRPRDVTVGALGTVHVSPGDYCYVGSAMGGLDQRLNRHLSDSKKVRWHIDNLTLLADRMCAYVSYDIPECELGRLVSAAGVPFVKGFGCSDCRCHTHLYKIDPDVAVDILASHGLTKFEQK